MTLTLEHLTYFKQRPLIKDISIDFESGKLYGILGPNGSGKSTLLKTMSRIWTPTSGKIIWQNQDLLQFTRLAMSRILTLVPQHPQIYFDFDVYRMVAMGCYQSSKIQVEQALHQVDAWHLHRKLMSQLSGGERQRIYIARALATQAPILLLDEPTSSLDLRHQLEVWLLLRSLTKQGKLVIVTLHDLHAAQRYCDQMMILNQGECQAIGCYEEVITPSLLKNIFGVYHNANKFDIYPCYSC